MRPVTLKDLAKTLGVSVTTVSKALKDYPDISEETKRQVKELAETLKYKPNIHAVTLRSQESKTLGVIVPKVDHHFFSEIINGVIEEAEKNGYLVISLFSNDTLELEQRQVQLLIDKRVDGILMGLTDETQSNLDHIHSIFKNEIPLVLFDRVSAEVNCSKVLIDDRIAAHSAVSHLLKSGCKEIMLLSGPKSPDNYRLRHAGYIQALEEHGITVNPNLIHHCTSLYITEALRITQKAILENPKIDGIFAATDMLALGALGAVQDLQKKIPDEISIIGFSNWFVTDTVRPHLSTVDQPSIEMGKKAVSLLVEEIRNLQKGITTQPVSVKLPTKLVLRNSTRN